MSHHYPKQVPTDYSNDSGVPPEREISEADIRDARLEAGYQEGLVNIVVVGNRGTGKSTLVNSLRGLGRDAPGRAEVGEVETTSQRAQYIDPLHSGIVWYDVPGAGTDKTTAWQYYYNQKLFIFDKIVLVHDTTLTEVCLH
jgi:ribosome biogenesis GTPase A